MKDDRWLLLQRNEHSHGIGKEHPRSHEIQLFCVILFLAVWVLDSFILNLTTTLEKEIHIIFRLLVFVLLVIITYR